MQQNLFIYLLAFCSGFTIMGIELLGGRILAPYFGSSVHIWGSIITVFMVSLSIGYLLGGKFSTNKPSLQKYGSLFILSGLLSLPIVLFATPILEAIFIQIEDSRYGSLAASIALFFIPTIFLGMISPYSIRLLISDTHKSGQVAGILYFVSTIGSALGTLMTSFYLVLWFEVNTIISFYCALLVVLGLVAITLGRLSAPVQSNEVSQHA